MQEILQYSYMKTIEETIKENIKSARKNSGLSQEELAKKIDVTHASISFWERGVNIPNVRDLWKMADELGMSIDELVGRDFDENDRR